MPLRSIHVENYRAIARGRVGFEHDTTVVFGENDSGRTAIFEALRLCLDTTHAPMQDRLRPYQFRRSRGGGTEPLRIGIVVDEPSAHAWDLPQRLSAAFGPSVAPRSLAFEFRADLDPARSVSVVHAVASPARPGVVVAGDDATGAWLAGAFPVLWLPPGELTESSEADGALPDGSALDDPDVRALVVHRRNLLAGHVADQVAELAAGAGAAQAVLDRYSDTLGAGGVAMSAMAAEILARPTAEAARAERLPANAAQQIAMLLLLGALAQLVGRVLRHGPLPRDAAPVLLVENPEANLHPTTLAALARLLEGIAWQKIVGTHSDALLATVPLPSLRRLTRGDETVRAWTVGPDALTPDALRKVSYHLRSRRAAAMFARCWLLVEGETEYWVLPELARLCGYDLAAEGVACVEFAQSGLAPLLVLADELGIATHVLVDGDEAGRQYATVVRSIVPRVLPGRRRATMLREPDIEHCFWSNGFDDVITEVAEIVGVPYGPPDGVIHRAIDRTSKPYLALSLIDEAYRRGEASVPAVLRRAIESAVRLARAPGA